MVILNFIGLDMYLVCDISTKYHSSLAKAFGVSEEELIITARDSFVIYKGHEQTSFNLLVKVEAPSSLREVEKEAKKAIFDACSDFSVHTRLLFTYFNESSYYENIDKSYIEYLENEQEVALDNSEYDQEGEYDEEEIYIGDDLKEF